MDLSFDGLLIVTAAALAAPLLLGLAPALRLPAVVLEIALGIAVGPHALGWVEIDAVLEVVALIGLAFLLFLAGLEIDPARIGGSGLRTSLAAYGVSLALAAAAGVAFWAAGLAGAPQIVAVALASTGLGIVVPVLRDAGESATAFGQLVIVWASVAELGSILLLTLAFSGEGGPASALLLLGGFVAVCAAVGLAVVGAERSRPLSALLLRLQDTTAQIRVRAAMVLLVALVALAEGLGLEAILGAFVAGALLSALDRDRAMTHTRFREKLDAVGFGVFIPVFFVTSGVRFDLAALGDPGALALVPLVLVAMVVVRGAPALLLRRRVGTRRALAGGLLQAVPSIAFLVATAEIGMGLGALSARTGAALIAAGLLALLLLPTLGLALLGRRGPDVRVPQYPGAIMSPRWGSH